MSETRRRFDDEFKKNAVRLSYASNKPVAEVTRDLDVSDAILYRWRQKYTSQGDKTRYATLEEEVKALKLENAELKIERDMLKKASLLCKPPQVIYAFIYEHIEYPVVKWAAHFGVSNSGYYEWLKERDRRKQRDARYAEEVKKAFMSGEGTYGVDRVCGILRRNGEKASCDKVAQHIMDLGLHSIHKRRRQRSLTDSRHAWDDSYPNLVRGLEITEPFQTYF